MATTTTNFGWDIPQSTDLVKDGATAIAALGQDIDTAMVDLKGGTTGQVLAKASGTDLDFSWVAQDDSNAIQNAIVDAKGDLIGATAADTPARLAVGTDGQVLTADSTAATGLKWASASSGFKGVSLYKSGGGTQTIANNTNTAITFDSEFFDTDGFHSTSTNTSRITIPAGMSGKYSVVSTALTWDINGTGKRGLGIYKNGAALTSSLEIIPSGSIYVSNALSVVIDLSAGDYIELYAIQTSGGNLTAYARNQDYPFTVTYLGA
jgi:hypothetical protein